MKVEHDAEHDVAYFAFAGGAAARHEVLDDARIVDHAADGSVVGFEFIAPSRGLDLAGVPRAAEIARAARRRGLRVLRAQDVARTG